MCEMWNTGWIFMEDGKDNLTMTGFMISRIWNGLMNWGDSFWFCSVERSRHLLVCLQIRRQRLR